MYQAKNTISTCIADPEQLLISNEIASIDVSLENLIYISENQLKIECTCIS
jgi:hypothetical protein